MRRNASRLADSGHAPVNGIDMYYEIHGREDGVPLVLLHGGGSTIGVTFSQVALCLGGEAMLPAPIAPTARPLT